VIDPAVGDPPVGFIVTDPDGLVFHANDLVMSWIGRPRDEVVGRTRFSDLLSAGGRIYYETHLAPTLFMLGTVDAIAFELRTATGERMPVFVTAMLDQDDHGQPDRIRIAVIDAAERRAYEVELLAERQRAEESEQRASLVARTLQQVLVPPGAPTIAGLDVGAAFRPAGEGAELGGDFYDIFELDDGSWYVTIGDVCGKGVHAAVVTALARNTVRAEVVRTRSLIEVLTMLNRTLLVHEGERHCTVSLVRLVQLEDGWRATICNGGHPLPLWRGADGSVARAGLPGTLLGVLPDVELREESVDLVPGTSLVLYTDGVVEGRTADELFGDGRLVELVERGAPEAQALADGIVGAVVDFQDGHTADDAAVVVVRVPG
jgi:sigma-B regulation protein RsbU (phosphoserine phosphatase)